MAYLKGNEVVSAIATILSTNFIPSDISAVYVDTPMQNTKKPFAFIHQINSDHENEMRNRARWVFLIDIRIHPKDRQTNTQVWARELAVKMIEHLNVIEVSGQAVRSRSLEFRVEDNVLHFIIGYAFGVIYHEGGGPNMEDLTYGQNIKI